MGEREGKRETERQRDKDRETERDRERQTEADRQRERVLASTFKVVKRRPGFKFKTSFNFFSH